MQTKKDSRLRRARKARAKIRDLGQYRLCINRT
ncbi:MAG: 50S ribosomal protein L18, partial [Algiphilus sp.]